MALEKYLIDIKKEIKIELFKGTNHSQFGIERGKDYGSRGD